MKTETKHTPGPWATFYENRDGTDGMEYKETQVDSLSPLAVLRADICVLACRDKKEQNANARLIAACPTMFSYIQLKAEQGDEKAVEIISKINA
jgi:hypothetical protein